MVPFVFSGFAGSKKTFPVMPSPDPLIDSKGASIWNIILFTPLGSLKSKSIPIAVREKEKKVTNERKKLFINKHKIIIAVGYNFLF
jgi:hypothetical protein